MRIKHFFKRIYTKLRYGRSCCETSSLFYFHAKDIAKDLRRFREVACAYPPQLESLEEWKDILGEMINGFEAILWLEDTGDEDKTAFKKAEKGLKLYAEYFYHLWY